MTHQCSISSIDRDGVLDAALETLLRRVYVDGGFTEAGVAGAAFRAANVRARGEVLVACNAEGQLLGTVVVVAGGSAASRFAGPGEAELHLLCVQPEAQRSGIGRALVMAALDAARLKGAQRVILWTQPSMSAAQRLYARLGFERVPPLDFSRGERMFLVFTRPI
jgi:ribosomal protein S18 acetylase RimI-like enzyme